MVHMGGESWYHQRSLSPIPRSQDWACGPSAFPICFFYVSRTFYVDK